MAQYYHLDVYRESYKLLVATYKALGNLNREYKYTIGEKVKERVFEILLEIYRASRNRDKRLYVERALDHIEYVRLSIRLLRDLEVLNDAKYVALSAVLEEVSVQFDKWRNYIIAK